MKIKEIGVSSRRMYIGNIADIFQKYIRNADIMPGYITQYCRYTEVIQNGYCVRDREIQVWRIQR